MRVANSVVLQWDEPATGGEGVRYVVYRTVGTSEKRIQVNVYYQWTDVDAPAGATYAISTLKDGEESDRTATMRPSVSGGGLMLVGQTEARSPQLYVAALPFPLTTHVVPLEVPDPPTGRIRTFTVSPNGLDRVSVRGSDDSGYAMWREPVTGGKAVRLLATPKRITQPEWSPDGTRVSYMIEDQHNGNRRTLHVMAASGGTPTTIGPVAGQHHAWMPDNRSVVVSDHDRRLVVIEATPGARTIRTVSGPVDASSPSVSPDGRWLAYHRYDNNTGKGFLEVVPLGGGKPVSSLPGWFVRTTWSPDGTMLAMPGRWGLTLLPVDRAGRVGTGVFHEVGAVGSPLDWYGAAPVFPATSPTLATPATVPFSIAAMPAGTRTTCQVDDLAPVACTSPFKVPSLAKGTHTLRVRAVDPTGRVAVAAREITVVGATGVHRLSGTNRYATAAQAALDAFRPGVPTAYVATGQNFPDALGGGPAAAHAGGPVLLVASSGVPSETKAALATLKPRRIVILGGTGVVSSAVQRELRAIAPVKRLNGTDRFSTATAIARDTFPDGVETAYIATGFDFPDALGGAPAAAKTGAPILLAGKDDLSLDTLNTLSELGVKRTVLLGGTGAVPKGVESQLKGRGSITRLSGANRYETAARAARSAYPAGAQTVYVATGGDFPDALGGGAAAAQVDAPVLLVGSTGVPTATRDAIVSLKPRRIVILGGTGVVSSGVETELKRLVAP